MSSMIFVNLPVKDLQRSIDFFSQLGFEFNPQFADKKAARMIVGDESFVMLLVEGFFSTFTRPELPGPRRAPVGGHVPGPQRGGATVLTPSPPGLSGSIGAASIELDTTRAAVPAFVTRQLRTRSVRLQAPGPCRGRSAGVQGRHRDPLEHFDHLDE